MTTIGNFTIDVWGPYPCWVHLTYGDTKIQFHHKELADIEYAIKKAMQEARLKLGTDKDEV